MKFACYFVAMTGDYETTIYVDVPEGYNTLEQIQAYLSGYVQSYTENDLQRATGRTMQGEWRCNPSVIH